MNVKTWIPLVAAVLLGLIALVVARKALEKGGTTEGKTAVMGIAVAKRNVPPGRELTAEDIEIAKLQADKMPAQTFTKVQDLVGRTTIQGLFEGQAIVEPLLAPTGVRGGLSVLIPQGYRAMTLEVNEFTGVSGMITPGAKVDVIAILRDEKNGQPAARTILQNLEVRAIGRNYNPAPPPEGQPQAAPSNAVTLLVTPKQAQSLQLASQNGRPWLVLRGTRDIKEIESELTTLAQLRGAADANDGVIADSATRPTATPVATTGDDPFGKPAPSQGRAVQVIRGGVESTIIFQDGAVQPTKLRPASTPVNTPATQPSRQPGNDGRFLTGADPRPVP